MKKPKVSLSEDGSRALIKVDVEVARMIMDVLAHVKGSGATDEVFYALEDHLLSGHRLVAYDGCDPVDFTGLKLEEYGK